MATNTTLAPGNRRAFAQIMGVLQNAGCDTINTDAPGGANVGRAVRRCWLCSEAPEVLKANYATYPLKVGDFVLDYANSDVYICAVAPTAAVDSTVANGGLILMNATNA